MPGPPSRRGPSGAYTLMIESLVVTVSGVASGGGRRRVTTAGPPTNDATEPAVQPPLPESGGPLKRRRS